MPAPKTAVRLLSSKASPKDMKSEGALSFSVMVAPRSGRGIGTGLTHR